MNAIAATTGFAMPAHYKDQVKMVRAAVTASWALAALAWLVDAFTTRPAALSVLEEDAPARPRYYGAFY